MNNAPRKRFGAYTVPMLKRLGLLAIPTLVVALLGGSIVLAQQSAPGDLTAPAPQATPEGTGPTGPTGPAAATPTTGGGPTGPGAAPPTPVPAPQPTPTTTGPGGPPPALPQPVPAGAAYLAANVPSNLLPVPELPQPPSPAASAAAMTAGDATLRP